MTGSSGNLLDHHARALIAGIPELRSALDIGPGMGKYGKLIRALRPQTHITGIEAEGAYLSMFNLPSIYDGIHVQRASWLLDYPDYSWDLVTAGDVIEHMRKSEGLDVLHYLVYRAKYLWIVWPMRYIQGSMDGHTSEAHMSVWTEDDIKALNADYVKFEICPLQGYAINGYPNAGKRVEEILGAV